MANVHVYDRDDIVTVLSGISYDRGIPCVYSHFEAGITYPAIAYIGAGQEQMQADGKVYWRSNTYQVELYFVKKDEDLEKSIEDAFIAGGWKYSKSDDAYLEGEGVHVIFYDLN